MAQLVLPPPIVPPSGVETWVFILTNLMNGWDVMMGGWAVIVGLWNSILAWLTVQSILCWEWVTVLSNFCWEWIMECWDWFVNQLIFFWDSSINWSRDYIDGIRYMGDNPGPAIVGSTTATWDKFWRTVYTTMCALSLFGLAFSIIDQINLTTNIFIKYPAIVSIVCFILLFIIFNVAFFFTLVYGQLRFRILGYFISILCLDKILVISAFKIGFVFYIYIRLWDNYDVIRVFFPSFWFILCESLIGLYGPNFDHYNLLNELMKQMILLALVELYKEPIFQLVKPIMHSILIENENSIEPTQRKIYKMAFRKIVEQLEERLKVNVVYVAMCVLPIVLGLMVKYAPVLNMRNMEEPGAGGGVHHQVHEEIVPEVEV